eukprot:763061-Hanusia_phi.AAC.3
MKTDGKHTSGDTCKAYPRAGLLARQHLKELGDALHHCPKLLLLHRRTVRPVVVPRSIHQVDQTLLEPKETVIQLDSSSQRRAWAGTTCHLMQTVGASQIFSPKIELRAFIPHDHKSRLLLHNKMSAKSKSSRGKATSSVCSSDGRTCWI